MITGPKSFGHDRRIHRPIGRTALFVASMVMALALTDRAEAQFGFGFGRGFGVGIYARPYTPPSVRMLNRVAATRAGMDQEALNRTNLAAPDRFDYRRQQIALQQRYDVESRRPIGSDYGGGDIPIARNAAGRASREERPAERVPPITSFVNEDDQVVWPADAPVSGDLGSLRDQADAEIREVALEYQATDSANIETVAEARQALLGYGRPALQSVRQNSTARVADSFHGFLLSLYESLAQAARGGSSSGPPPID